MQLYPYQEEGVAFLADRTRAYLMDGMGLGKTAQACVAARRVGVRRPVVVAPASTLENWHREWEEWGPPGVELVTTSWSSRALHHGLVQEAKGDLVVLDEAHYAKNPKAKRTRAALELARSAPRSWLLSGTPMPNHPGELWAVVRVLWPGITKRLGLNRHDDWFSYFCLWYQTRYGRRPYGVKNQGQLRRIVSFIGLRRQLGDVGVQLPPLQVHVHLLPRDAGFDHEDLGPLLARMEREEGREDEWASTARLRRFLGEYKATRVAKVLNEELQNDSYGKVVVMGYHRNVLGIMRRRLKRWGVVGFDGGTPKEKRQREVDAFRAGQARVFVAQQTAAGTGLDGLQDAASELVLLEPDWSPGPNRQAIKRIHRLGQDSPCRARVFAVADSLDESIMRLVATKTEMQQEVGV